MALTFVMSMFATVQLGVVLLGVASRGELAWDFSLYTRIASHWLTSGSMYFPVQFSGSYTNLGEVNLYPPTAMALFVPFLVLPPILWWAIPIGIIAGGLIYWRPAWWSWPLIALAFVPVEFAAGIALGNTGMWAMATVMLATRWPAAAIGLAVKPSMFPIAFVFAKNRAFWLASLCVSAASVLLLPNWLDWWRAVSYFTPSPLAYSLGTLPLLLVPVGARLATTRQRDPAFSGADAALRKRRPSEPPAKPVTRQ